MTYSAMLLVALLGFAAVDHAVANCEWTQYFNRDRPSGSADYEALSYIKSENPGIRICDKPSQVEARTVSTHIDASATGQVVSMSPTFGFACYNNRQTNGRTCMDYEVRFCCPRVVECNQWTRYYSRDIPTGDADYESLDLIRQELDSTICQNPAAVEARTVADKVDYSPNTPGADIVTMNPTFGFSCTNSQQTHGQRCKDYEVRFCCLVEEPRCDGEWTGWKNRDGPSGSGDYETVGDFIKNPSWGVCRKPTAIQRSPAVSSDIVHMNPSKGVWCVNAQQPNRWCQNYQANFCCPRDEL